MNSRMHGLIKYTEAGCMQPQIREVAEIRVDLIYFSEKKRKKIVMLNM